jgi:hypothetical protein
VSLAILRASASSLNLITAPTGPKISSLAMTLSVVTSVKRVGSTNKSAFVRLAGKETHCHKVAFVAKSNASDSTCSALLLGFLDVAHGLIELNFADLGTHQGSSLERVGYLDGLGCFQEQRDEFIIN